MEMKSEVKKLEIRYLFDLKKVLYDQKWLKKAKNFPVYYIWRGIKKKNNLRYDTTAIPPQLLGREFVKTKGHYHLGKYGELYKILEGKAIFLIQKEKTSKSRKQFGGIGDVYYTKAKKGDFIVIPPHYGHVAINPYKKTLKMANWVSLKCQNDYQLFEKRKGGGYYYTKSGWLKNKNYKKIPKLRFERPLKKKLSPRQIKLLVEN